MAIITTAQFKTYRSISASTWDTLLGVLITAAQAKIERYCDRIFDPGNQTETFDGNDSDTLLLKAIPVTSITSVTITGDSGTTSTLASTAYRVNALTGELFRLGATSGRFPTDAYGATYSTAEFGIAPCWPIGFQNVTVVYVGGYSTMPTDLQLAMYQYVDAIFSPIENGAGVDPTMSGETLGAYSYQRGGMQVMANGTAVMPLSAFMMDLLRPFRRAVT